MKTILHLVILICIFLPSKAQIDLKSRHYSFRLFCIGQNRKFAYGGSGFVVKKDSTFYLVTALHVFNKTNDYFADPRYGDSRKAVIIFSKTLKNIHSQDLTDTVSKTVFYKSFRLNYEQSLDLAVLKLKGLEVKNLGDNFVNYSDIDTALQIENNTSLRTMGYPTVGDTDISTSAKDTVIIPTPASVFLYFPSIDSAEGLSGSPIFMIKGNKTTLKGVYFASDTTSHPFGVGIYAAYVKSTIDLYDNTEYFDIEPWRSHHNAFNEAAALIIPSMRPDSKR